MLKDKSKFYSFYEKWRSLSIKDKIGVLLGTSILSILVSLALTVFILLFTTQNFKVLLDDNIRCYNYVDAIQKEDIAFRQYTKYRTEDNRVNYEKAVSKTREAISNLPYDYKRIGAERFAKTWNIKSAYKVYSEMNERVLSLEVTDCNYITELYKVYNTNTYLVTYGNRLIGMTLKDSSLIYHDMIKKFYILPVITFALAFIYILAGKFLNGLINKSISEPVYKLAEASERIARNEYDFPDIEIDNRDELYMLSMAFNKMKQSTKNYIRTLEEKQIIADKLHEEEIEKIEVEQKLESLNFELLKSQVNPHFLFNTLNMIACNARLEDAPVTVQMTNALGELFRYSLRTRQSVVILSQELNMLEQYIYIQKMRFGDRMEFELNCNTDSQRVMIPPFTLQPLVENCIVHGLQGKEDGGKVNIDINKIEKGISIDISDNGKGISEEQLKEITENIKYKRTSNAGIGLGNIYRIFMSMYGEKCEFKIKSELNVGTRIHILIPEGNDYETVSNSDSR